ncbi:winged helix-turn-helix transcriptional regulator [Actinomadura sp. NAK00032]|uniref:ArsR/SmtB family transcription factor n=1 Tax=Actinomadura sp. NAK00032 TaxID=2742128 RepID=UPI0015924163|nr:winged helix-turn-helix domain-containing protein [Actinomadura sp. NAK00032]QKW38206.1 winged helix-turn-helix transcriptional regulator [Actinomadura sp. NAK00032]
MSWEKEPLVPLRALANPLRVRIVSLLTGTAMSATEVAEELGLAHGSASYHLRQLAAAGFLEQVGDEPSAATPGRGRAPKRYRYDPTSADRLDRSSGRLLQSAMFTDLRRRLEAMTVQRLSADAEVWISPEDWERARALVAEAVDLVHRGALPPRSEGSVHVSVTTLLFELSDVR